ncbi:tetratricopeptide repeat protein, partial [Nocardia sp. NPDC057272]|uniref:tetratricopeptide repeat protein n=1 Tax=Nocardia sp. NPDC057272 TaxID=3346079 RepID=UPI003633DA5B
MRELVQVHGIDDLPTVAEVDPYWLGATSSAFGRAGEYGRRDSYVARTANRVDERLSEALVGDRLIVVVGPSKAGKTRTLFEAIHADDPDARVVWPTPDGVVELAAHPRLTDTEDTLVVWLDDLHVYLTSTVLLTPAVLARLSARRGRTVVVATLRSEMRARLRGGGGELRQENRMLLEQAVTIDLVSTSEDPNERAAATSTYPEQGGDGYGLAEVLAGAPELLARYDDARVADPPLYAVIATAVDWARIGRNDPIPEPVLIDLALGQLRSAHPHLDATTHGMRAATAAARTPPAGAGRAAALLTTYLNADTRGYKAFDYLVAADDGQDHRSLRPIPDNYWHNATRECDPATLTRVGFAAYTRSNEAIAHTFFRKAADAGSVTAVSMLGALLAQRGDWAEAEPWLRKAAEAQDATAAFNLGALFTRRGDWAAAEPWLRKAADAGDAIAASNLGAVLAQRGDWAAAEPWLRKAANAGDAIA